MPFGLELPVILFLAAGFMTIAPASWIAQDLRMTLRGTGWLYIEYRTITYDMFFFHDNDEEHDTWQDYIPSSRSLLVYTGVNSYPVLIWIISKTTIFLDPKKNSQPGWVMESVFGRFLSKTLDHHLGPRGAQRFAARYHDLLRRGVAEQQIRGSDWKAWRFTGKSGIETSCIGIRHYKL